MEEKQAPEIVIIKRKKGGGDGHHGGVWKIAYADFMTAMMAFFLVMWLINASNEETRAQVASYFNPVKLVDATAQPRGLNDKEAEAKTTTDSKGHKKPDELKEDSKGSSSQSKMEKTKADEKHMGNPGEKETKEQGPDGKLFSAPMETLDKIAGGPPKSPIKKVDVSKITKPGVLTQYTYKDPFAPKDWQVLKVEKLKAPSLKKGVKKKKQSNLAAKKKSVSKAKKKPVTTDKQKIEKQKSAKAFAKATNSKTLEKKTMSTKEKSKLAQVSKKKKQAVLLAKLKSTIAAASKVEGAKRRPQATVARTKQGVLVSVTDDHGFGMFNVASAKPTKELVIFMEKISGVLAQQQGKIVIKGHTDGRPFHSKDYDNWRLSSARAQIARYMLIRGGTKKERFVRIEGHADRKLKIPDKPYDARNRRIEILLLDEAS